MSLLTRALEEPIVSPDSFLDDRASEQLREVSWIDPNFVDLAVLDPNSNDDHPPSDIGAGQAFVLEVMQRCATAPGWEDTLLIVLYDEHGDFYDQVAPPKLPFDDGSGHETYGRARPGAGDRPARRKRSLPPRVRPHELAASYRGMRSRRPSR